MNESSEKREEFRAKLADLGRSEETVFSSKVLEAYDRVHCPELREKELFSEETPEGGKIRLVKYQNHYELWHHGEKVWKY